MRTYLPLGLGVVGAGRFASFLAEAVADLPDVVVRVTTDHDREAAAFLAKQHDARVLDTVEDLVADEAVDVVVVATPPASHAAIATLALRAGRHVFCEKPLATSRDDLTALVAAAETGPGVLVVDHVLRFNPLLAAVARLQDDILGPPQRFLFENDASDEDLDDDHWFWDAGHSGGIFVEHGVHFFDAAAMLLGRPATAVQATASRRTGTGLTDLVSATVQHGDDVLATHTHSFTHAHRCERQLMRLDHGAAETRMNGWIPVDAVVDLWTDDAGVTLCEALPGRTSDLLDVPGFRLGGDSRVTVDVRRDAGSPTARGRGHDLQVPHHVRIHLTLGGPAAKAAVYAESVRAAMADLVLAVRTGSTPRSGIVTGAAATTLALAATRASELQQTVHLPGDPS
ncbi:MAG: Gfo/Idh/MocA family oxidoreductase [Nocardioidaceae bacterium]